MHAPSPRVEGIVIGARLQEGGARDEDDSEEDAREREDQRARGHHIRLVKEDWQTDRAGKEEGAPKLGPCERVGVGG